jgi:hypothetical protein
MIDPFERGKVWFIYNKLEKEFIDTTSYVALETVHENVWSEKFGELLVKISGSVGSFFDLMVNNSKSLDGEETVRELRKKIEEERKKRENKQKKRKKKSDWSPDIRDFRKAFNRVFQLSSVEVEASYGLTYYGKLQPFKGFERKSPLWWESHNKLKHKFFEQLEERATLQNTVNALAGLFVLNILHKENRQYVIRHTNVIYAEGISLEFMEREIESSLEVSFVGVPKDKQNYRFIARTQLFTHVFRVDNNKTSQEYYSIPH